MSETTLPPAAPSAPAPATSTINYGLVAKWGAAFLLGCAVLALDVLKIPADHFITLVVMPGLTALGLHTSAKTLT
jgi:hypothetical protein